MNRRMFNSAGLLLAAGVPLAAKAQGSDWPNREIQMLIPTTPGGAADLSARAVATKASQSLGVPIVVRNIPGGGATLGAAQLAAAKPDGYTFGMAGIGSTLVAPHLMKLPYTLASFDGLGSYGEGMYGLAVGAQSPIKSVADLVAEARRRRVTVSANAVVNMVCMMALGSLTGVQFHWVATNSQAEAVAQAAGGHVDATLQSAPDLSALADSGQIRLLASANDVRWPTRPDLPTMIEQGFNARNRVPYGFSTPLGVDPAIRARLEKALFDAASDPEVARTMLSLGVISKPLDAKTFDGALHEMAPVIEKMMIDAGMKKT